MIFSLFFLSIPLLFLMACTEMHEKEGYDPLINVPNEKPTLEGRREEMERLSKDMKKV